MAANGAGPGQGRGQEGMPPEGWRSAAEEGFWRGKWLTNRVDPVAWGRRPLKSQGSGDGGPAAGEEEG